MMIEATEAEAESIWVIMASKKAALVGQGKGPSCEGHTIPAFGTPVLVLSTTFSFSG